MGKQNMNARCLPPPFHEAELAYSTRLAITAGDRQYLHKTLCNAFELRDFVLVIVWPRERFIAQFLWDWAAAYRTATHAFEAMKAMDLRSAAQFEIGGLFDAYDVIDEWPDSMQVTISSGLSNDMANELLACCRNKSMRENGMIGLVARFVGNVSVAFAQKWWSVRMGRVWRAEHTCLLWEIILKAKFVLGSTQADVLLSTGSAYLLNHSQHATPQSLSCGFFNEQKELVGYNMAGKYLMAIRGELVAEVELNLKAHNRQNDWALSLSDHCEALSLSADLWEEC
jgi:hypothetical protein